MAFSVVFFIRRFSDVINRTVSSNHAISSKCHLIQILGSLMPQLHRSGTNLQQLILGNAIACQDGHAMNEC